MDHGSWNEAFSKEWGGIHKIRTGFLLFLFSTFFLIKKWSKKSRRSDAAHSTDLPFPLTDRRLQEHKFRKAYVQVHA